MDTIEQIINLTNDLNKYRDEYYNKNSPSISDQEYDKLFDELKVLEEESGFIMSNSPTQTVGFAVLSDLKKVKHPFQLLSLDKSKDNNVIKKFLGDKPAVIMHKLDGLTTELLYENGILVQASTRGDGDIGEDITHNAKTFKNVPLKIPYNNTLRIVGESIIRTDDFIKINNELPEDEKYKNPRNLVSGSVRQLDSSICSKRNVHFYAFNVIEGFENNNSFISRLSDLEYLGFEICLTLNITKNFTIEQYEENLKQNAALLKHPIDGLVFAFNDVAYGRSLGKTGHHYNYAIAFKFEDDSATTTLKDIEWSMGKTGVLTPVAIFDTVELDGTDVSRASLHNVSILKQLELGIGDQIVVAKANMIIPQVIDNLTRSNEYRIPQLCPICGHRVEISKENDSETLICINNHCDGKLIQRLTHFVSKPAMNIDGLSESTIEKFVEAGLLNNLSDIFKLVDHKEKICKMDGFGERSVVNLQNAINNSKEVNFENFLYALSIDNIGKSASKAINKRVGGKWIVFDALLCVRYDWTELDDFGEVMNSSLYKFFDDKDKWGEVLSVLNYIKFNEHEENIKPQQASIFCGKSIVITGTFEKYKRTDLTEIIEKLGGKVNDSVSKNTDYLIAGDKAGSKLSKAHDLGIKILNENDLLTII